MMLAGAVTVGCALTSKEVESTVVPHSFVAASITVLIPAVEKTVAGGVAAVEFNPGGSLVQA